MNKSQKLIVAWLFLGCLLVYMMVVIGGVTRLTHSGLSIVNWNLLGKRPPSSEKDWTELFDAYKAYPEYQQVNFNFTVDEFKFIFWWEYSHRFLGRMIGVIFLVPFLLFWWKGFLSRNLLKKLAVLLLLGGFQGLLGWYMVKSGLDKLPRVSHFRLAAHLLSAFTVFGFTFWTALDLIYPLKEKVLTRPLKGIRWLSIFLFACIVVQILYGAFVAGLRAGLLCPTWPKMCGEWVHSSVWSLEPAWRNFIEGGAGVQFVHRSAGSGER